MDSRELSPGMISMIVFTGGEVHSSKRATVLLKRWGMGVSCNTVQRVLGDVGDELVELRDNDQLSSEKIESASATRRHPVRWRSHPHSAP